MSRDGNGTYNKIFTAVTGTVISSTDVNAQIDDIATALTGSLAKNGETVPSANLPMGAFKHTNVGQATAGDQYASAGQVQNSGMMWGGTAGGTATALTFSVTPAISAYAAGQRFAFIAASNSGGATTLAVNGLAAKTVNNVGWATGDIVEVAYSGTAFYVTSGKVEIPSGTVMLFFQAAAPTGWTQVTSQNDKLLRVVSGTGGGSGGAWGISGLTTESATHGHTISGTTGGPSANTQGVTTGGTAVPDTIHTHAISFTSGTENALHTHTGDGTWRPAYINVITASKNA